MFGPKEKNHRGGTMISSSEWSLLPEERDPGYRWWGKNGNWGYGEIYLALCYCDQRRCVIDIGAAYGAATRIYAKNFDQVIAIEMNQRLIPHLIENTSEFENVKYYNLAMSDFIGSANFSEMEWTGLSSLKPLVVKGEKKPVKIKTTVNKLNSFLTKTNISDVYGRVNDFLPVDLIKIDVEGAETEVLLGGIKLIEKYKPTIQVEIHGNPKKSASYQFLYDNDYLLMSAERRDYFFQHKEKCHTFEHSTLWTEIPGSEHINGR